MKLFRRVALALGIAAAIGGIAKLRGKDRVPPSSGGWRQLDATTFR